MKPQKFFAPTTRAALAKVREALGDDAIILSNRPTADGVEIRALAERDFESLVATTPAESAPAQVMRSARTTKRVPDQPTARAASPATAGAPVRFRSTSEPAQGAPLARPSGAAAAPRGEASRHAEASSAPAMGDAAADDALYTPSYWNADAEAAKPFRFIDYVRNKWISKASPAAPSKDEQIAAPAIRAATTPKPSATDRRDRAIEELAAAVRPQRGLQPDAAGLVSVPPLPSTQAVPNPVVAPVVPSAVELAGATDPLRRADTYEALQAEHAWPAQPSLPATQARPSRQVRESVLSRQTPEIMQTQPAPQVVPLEQGAQAAFIEQAPQIALPQQASQGPHARQMPHLPPSIPAPILDELKALRSFVAERFDLLAAGADGGLQLVPAMLRRELVAAGFQPVIVRALLESLPVEFSAAQARDWVEARLVRSLVCANAADDIIDSGGVYALTGATGVGKTTTAAKLAARCAVRYGADSVGLITTDTYRIGAPDQLRIYGKILGVPVHTVHDPDWLKRTLETLSGRRLVLIDTIGMSQRDGRVAANLEMLDRCNVKRLLLLAASSQAETLEEVIELYNGRNGAGAVLTKIDETVKLAPALSVLLRYRMKLRYITNGQRVPEDLLLPNATSVVHTAVRPQVRAASTDDGSERRRDAAQVR